MSFEGFTLSFTTEDFRWPRPGCDPGGAGDIGREPGIGVLVPEGWGVPCFFLCFFRTDSFPEDSERFGEPDLLRAFLAFFKGSVCLGLPDGVFVPLDDAPEGSFDLALASSSFLRSISFCFSSSEVSSSL